MFRAGAGISTAADSNDHVIYNKTTGALYYDADGSGATPAVQFAKLSAGLALTHADFLVT
jgi:Ca2+-binding RTX toxin-like protein